MTPPLTLVEIGACDQPNIETWSPFCLKVHRALKAMGLPYQRLSVSNPSAGKRYNPTGQFPSLLIGQEAVPDSTAILKRLETLASRSLNSDPSPAVRAEALLWEELGDTAINGFLVAARWADDRNWDRTREAVLKGIPTPLRRLIGGRARKNTLRNLIAREVWRAGPEVCWQRFRETLDLLEARAPASGYWVGSALSVADLGLFAQLHSLRTPLTPWQAEELGKRKALSAYLDRIHQETWQRASV